MFLYLPCETPFAKEFGEIWWKMNATFSLKRDEVV